MTKEQRSCATQEKGLLMALEADAYVLIKELDEVFRENPLIYAAIQENTEILHRMVMINAKLSNLKRAREVTVEKNKFIDIIKENMDNWGIFEGTDGNDFISNVIDDLEKSEFVFFTVETPFVAPVPDGGVTEERMVPEEPDEKMIDAATYVLTRIDCLNQELFRQIACKVWKAMALAKEGR